MNGKTSAWSFKNQRPESFMGKAGVALAKADMPRVSRRLTRSNPAQNPVFPGGQKSKTPYPGLGTGLFR